MNEHAHQDLSLEHEIRNGLKNQQFLLYFQPQMSLKDGSMVGMEALIRWHHPSRGLLSPDKFIPLAGSTGLIVPLGEWVLRTACELTQQLHEKGFKHLKVAVNLSARQFKNSQLVDTIKLILEETKLSPWWLELEITEGILLEDVDENVRIFHSIKELGVSLAIDDFGIGYSSLSYLKRLPLDILKIDRSFVKDIPMDKSDMDISAALIAMSHKLRLQVVAEGVETAAQVKFLTDNHCDIGQGYFFSRPVPFEKLVEKLLHETEEEVENVIDA